MYSSDFLHSVGCKSGERHFQVPSCALTSFQKVDMSKTHKSVWRYIPWGVLGTVFVYHPMNLQWMFEIVNRLRLQYVQYSELYIIVDHSGTRAMSQRGQIQTAECATCSIDTIPNADALFQKNTFAVLGVKTAKTVRSPQHQMYRMLR